MNAATSVVPAATAPEDLLASLRWRVATKKFDPSRKIPEAAWLALEEALVLSPSSYGLQPWRFFVVDDPALRAQLKAASWGQAQVTDADKLVVFAVKKDFGPADVDRFVARMTEVLRKPASDLEPYRKMMLASVSKPAAELSAWLIRQVYIALGFFLTSAAALGVDACPMEGIDKVEYDRILRLPEKGWHAVVAATAGYRAADDGYAAQAKVRFPKHEVVAHL